MITRYTQRDLTWVDLVHPTPAEVKALIKEFGFDPMFGDELLVPSFKPKVERHGDAIYVILHFPSLKLSGTRAEQEIDFIIGKKFLITTRYENIDPLHSFARAFEVNAVLGRGTAVHGGHLFAAMAYDIYHALGNECDTLHRRLVEIEDNIYTGNEREMVIQISQVGRVIHDFRQALLPHKEMLNSLEPVAVRFFDQAFSYYVHNLVGAYEHVQESLGHLRESLTELRDTNDSLLSTKQNDIMKTLTVLAFIFLPLSFIAGLFGMNTQHIPIVGSPYDFWIVAGIMLVVASSCFVFFKYKDWI